MPKGDQDQRGVAVGVAAVLRAVDQALDLVGRQVPARTQLGVGRRRAMSGATVCFPVVARPTSGASFGHLAPPR